MKTIQELYNEVMGNEELKAQCIEAAKAGRQEAFLKEHGCEATPEEVKAFLEAKQNEDAPLSLDELDNAAGGECTAKTAGESVVSVISLGVGCVIWINVSAHSEGGYIEQQKEGDGRLCNYN